MFVPGKRAQRKFVIKNNHISLVVFVSYKNETKQKNKQKHITIIINNTLT